MKFFSVFLQVEISMDKATSCMQASKSCHLQVATGGKENDLKVWDGNKPEKPVFQAKNVNQNTFSKNTYLFLFSRYQVQNDWLDLRVPVWVSQVCFVPATGDKPTVVVGTGYHQV